MKDEDLRNEKRKRKKNYVRISGNSYGTVYNDAAGNKLCSRSMKQLMNQGVQLTNIPITDDNIKSFERIARKYGIDYSLKKDVSTDPPRFMVFFKAKDVDVMTAAFKEYAGVSMKQKVKKPSVKKKLAKTVQRKVKHRQKVKQKNKDRGQDR